ncbi:magnesium-translocating P-type ATPase [Streptomyces griseorubiginosus]|uniref:magnesium-translocating P-type ATPase n=1 Tax=Streptomyces griseorubiginosus TaxID=67304 RepID=UPI002E822FAA|nr:magnesium-translocating P-type ATPase [Streptomyces griseorubiginosus]WUB49995.1 magnesium-translocating P-type ATPase [Streptomyces griseorubiginosus]WUB58528.1 magnesium-translocating P-type ATPase [Streptomyces griseorubiginosus]
MRGAGTEVPGESGRPAPTPSTTPTPTLLEVFRRLDAGPRGLTEGEAEERLARVGENRVPDARDPSWARLFARSARDPFTAVLLCLGLVSAAVHAWGTASVILLLVVVSCVLRASGEHRADRSTAGLRRLVATTVTVQRRADEDTAPATREIPVEELVPGDVVRLGPGDLIPADVRLLRSAGLTVHQAALTGESAPVRKSAAESDTTDSAAGTGDFQHPHLCFQGTSVAAGSATAVVTATGADTRFAAAYRRTGKPPATTFERSVQGVSWILIRFALLTPPLVLMANAALRGRGLETLPFAVAVAVGLTPEMLPVLVTTCLARGAARLARTHDVIVRRLPALHDIGAMDVLCVDKTGTLTQDRPVVDRALDAEGHDDPGVLRWAAAAAWWSLQLADLPAPDALDEALLTAVDEDTLTSYDGVTALPFDPGRRLATVVVRTPGRLGTHTLITKGAAEAVLERCALSDEERARLRALAAAQAADGLRVLAVATAERPAGVRPQERGLTFRGLVTLRDELAPTAAEALAGLAARGVTVKVLTGDHPGTAARACRDLGIPVDGVLTADRLDTLTDAELTDLAGRTTVFARCTPDHKTRITRALQTGGHTVGFLGDGVNDLPALRTADVGLAPRDAAGVTRDNADLVLAGKDLTAIGHAVAAGRHAGGNIASYLRITLSSNLGNVIAMLSAGLLLPFLPMLPAQVLVQNLCFDAAQLAFAYDRPAPSALRRPTVLDPRALLRFIVGFGALNAVADLATFGVLAFALRGPGDDEALFHSGWFTENLLTQAVVMVLLSLGVRGGLRGTRDRRPGPVTWSAAALAATGLFLPMSPLGTLLGLSPLPGVYYGLLAAVLALYAVGLTAARAHHEHRSRTAG